MKRRLWKIIAGCLCVATMMCSVQGQNAGTQDADEQSEPVPYSADEFPQWSKDLRRAEIVTLGSLPFVTMGVTAGYGSYQYALGNRSSFPNPFDKGQSYSNRELAGIIGTSLGISATIGLTDFIINRVQHKKKEQERLLEEARQRSRVKPLSAQEAGDLLRKNTFSQQNKP